MLVVVDVDYLYLFRQIFGQCFEQSWEAFFCIIFFQLKEFCA